MDYNLLALQARKDPACLSDWVECGMISFNDLDKIKEIMKENELKLLKVKVLQIHTGTIFEPTAAEPRWWTYVHDSRCRNSRRKIARKKECDLYSSLLKHYEDQSKDKTFTIASLYPQWLKHKEMRTEASTYIKRVNCEWNRIYEGTSIIEEDIRELTKLQLEDWAYGVLRKMGHVKTKYYNATMIMRQILDYAVDLEIIETNPFRRVHIDARHDFRTVVKPEPETQVFSPAEKQAMIDLAWKEVKTNPKLRYPLSCLAVPFQLYTGLRVGELCAVRYEDIKGNVLKVTHFVRLQDELVDGAKTPAGVREIPLPDEAMEIVEYCLAWQKRTGQEGPFLFSGKDPLKPRIMTDRYSTFCEKLGILKRSSHKARKTYVSTLIDAGINIDTVRKTAGHTSTQVTLQNYTFDRLEKERRNRSIIEAVSGRSDQ